MKTKVILEIQSEFEVYSESIQKAYPSIYSKQDVLQMLSGFVENITRWVTELPEEATQEQGHVMSVDDIQSLTDRLMSGISRKVDRLDAEEVVDYSSASFSIGYSNTIEIDSIDYISDRITEEVETAVEEVLHDFFTPEEAEAPAELETPYATEQ